jgi:hypothetical protein
MVGDDTYLLDNNFGADVIMEVDFDNFIEFIGSEQVTVEFGTGLGEPVDLAHRLTIDTQFFQGGRSGSGDDFFILAGDAMPGDRDGFDIDGGGGIDTFVYLNFNAPVLVDATTGFATGWGFFESFERVVPNPNQPTEVIGLEIVGPEVLPAGVLNGASLSLSLQAGAEADDCGCGVLAAAGADKADESSSSRRHVASGAAVESPASESEQQPTEEDLIDELLAAAASPVELPEEVGEEK